MKELSDPAGTFTISVPADWTSQAAATGAMAVAPTMKASILVGVMPKGLPAQQALDNLIQSQKQTVPGWTLLGQDVAQVGGRQAAHLHAEGQPNNVPSVGDYYLIETDQALIVIVLSAAKDSLAQSQGALAQALASFRVGGGQLTPFAQPQPPQPFQPQPPQPFQPQPFQPQPQPPQPIQPQPFQPQPFQPQPGPGALKQVTDAGGAFSLSVPGDWVVQQQAGVAACMEPTGRCGVSIMAQPKVAQSAEQLAQAMVAIAQQNMQGWQQQGTQQAQVAGRPAVYVRATAQVMNNQVAFDYFFLVTDTRQVVIVVSCMAQEAAQRQAQLQQILQTLRIQ